MKRLAGVLVFAVLLMVLSGCSESECDYLMWDCSRFSSPVATPTPHKPKLEKVCTYEVGDFCVSFDWVVQ